MTRTTTTIRTKSGATLVIDGSRVEIRRPTEPVPYGYRSQIERVECFDLDGVAAFIAGFLRADPEVWS